MATERSSVDDQASRAPGAPRAVWIAIILLTATIIGIAGGFLTHSSGLGVPGSVLAGGGAFSTATLLLLAIAHYADGGRV